MTRNLVTQRTVSEIRPIPGADRIEVAIVGGWECVVRKGEYQAGDPCLYFEIDSFIPASDDRFSFLSGHTKTFNDVEGYRLRTVKLRGQISQGLLMKPSDFPELEGVKYKAEALDIQKWEAPIPACLRGQIAGKFPSFIPRTDQERVQNIPQEELNKYIGDRFEVTVKLDGTSVTVYYRDGHVGVCSRNWELKVDAPENKNNTIIKIARESGLLDYLASLKKNYAFQGELIGEGIQGNNEKLKGHSLYIFDIWNIDAQRYLTPLERRDCLWGTSAYSFIVNTPLIAESARYVEAVDDIGSMKLPVKDGNVDIAQLIADADGASLTPGVAREGVVWKHESGAFSFKVVSNAYLLKGK